MITSYETFKMFNTIRYYILNIIKESIPKQWKNNYYIHGGQLLLDFYKNLIQLTKFQVVVIFVTFIMHPS